MRQRTILYGVSGFGIVALVVVVLVVVFAGGSSNAKGAVQALTAAGCQYKHPPAQARTPHFTTLTPNPPPSWNTYPPSG
jgi:hypothetical protein